MKKKTKGIIFMIVVVIALIVIFCNQPVEVNREIRHNTIHKREDIRLVMDKALANMDQDGITVTDVYYDGMESQTFEKNLIHDGYQDAIVVYLDFHTGFFHAGRGIPLQYHVYGRGSYRYDSRGTVSACKCCFGRELHPACPEESALARYEMY